MRRAGAVVLVLMLAACSTSSGRIPDQPVPLTEFIEPRPWHTVGVRSPAMGEWEQPSLPAEGLEAEPAVDTRALIRRYRDEGYGYAAVASLLNARGTVTPSGRGRWWAATVRQYLDPAAHAADVAERRRRQGKA